MDFSRLVFWIQIYDLPLENMKGKNGMHLGNKIGEALEADDEIFSMIWGLLYG